MDEKGKGRMKVQEQEGRKLDMKHKWLFSYYLTFTKTIIDAHH